MLRVGDILTRNVRTVSPDDSLAHAASLMAGEHISCIVAIDDGKPDGILTEADLVHIGRLGVDIRSAPVHQYLSRPLLSISPDKSLFEAYDLLFKHHVRHLVVLDDTGGMAGVVTFTDLLKATEFDDFLKAKQVGEVMSRNVVGLAPDAPLHRALELMDGKHLSCMVAVEDGKAVGLFTERDAARLLASGEDFSAMSLRQAMSDRLVTMHEADSLLEASHRMREHGFRRMVIVDDAGAPAGILTQFDVVHGLEGKRMQFLKQQFASAEAALGETRRLLVEKTELEKRYRSLFDEARDMMHIFDAEGRIVDINRAELALLGYEREELIGEPVSRIICPRFRGKAKERLERLLQGKTVELAELALHDKQGECIAVEASASPQYEGDRIVAGRSILRDIRDRKGAEQALVQSEEKYRSLFDEAHDLIHITDGEGRITDVNPAECVRLGYTREEMIGRPVLDFIHPEHVDECRAFITCIANDGKLGEGYETCFRTRDGKDVWVEVSASAQHDAEGRVVAIRAILHDVTDRVDARRALQQSTETMRAVARNLTGIVFQFGVRPDGNWYFPYVSESVERFLGISADEVMADAHALFARVHPADTAGLFRDIEAAVSGCTRFVWQGRFLSPDSEVLWFSCSSEPQELEDGSTVWNGVALDETAQHRLEEQFRQAQKMESVGTLVGGIAHDFNNMLAGMMGQLYLVRHDLAGDEPLGDAGRIVERIQAVEQHGKMAADVIAQLMTFARKGQVSMERHDLNRLVSDAMRLHRVSIPENIEIRAHLGDALDIEGDAGMIQQMLLNLMTNARDALSGCERPHIDISLTRFIPDAAFLRRHGQFDAVPHACLEVSDNGCGMGEQQVGRIFDPFFTTKEIGKGTGLGLAMLYGAMQTHGGHVLVDSQPGKGACFRLYFPLLAEAGEEDVPVDQAPVRGHGQTILLADDETMLNEVISQALQLIGYRVVTACNGEEAVRLFREQRGGIALAMLDVVMPLMGGVQAAEHLREMAPELPLIFHTGYGEEVDLGVARSWESCVIVKKPANIEQLSRIIAGLIPGD